MVPFYFVPLIPLCRYGEGVDEKMEFDCLLIPSVSVNDDNGDLVKLPYSEFCGSSVVFQDFDDAQDSQNTICCK